jgi:predicted TIM-barrel fold metal-dependent hydrolase
MDVLSAAVYVQAPIERWTGGPGLARFLSTCARGPATDVRAVLADLDARGISGAVLYPHGLARAFGVLEEADLRVLCERYDDWALELAAQSDRLRAVAMVSVTEPQHAADRIAALASRGAAGAMIPLYPHTERRYDNRSYAPLWRALEQHALPAIFHRGATRDVLTDPMPFDLALSHVGPGDRLFGDLLDVLDASYARLALVSMILSGVFARHPKLRVVVTGYGAGWVPYALLRMDGQYIVRPERAGDAQSEEPDEALDERHAFAQERRGFSFPAGVLPSDHFRSHVFVAAGGTKLDLDVLPDVGEGHLLWASGHVVGEAPTRGDRDPALAAFYSGARAVHFAGAPS